jgi:hypothetical protein
MKIIFTPMGFLNPTSGGMVVLEQQMADLKSAGFEVYILYCSNNEWNVFNYLDRLYPAISLSEITKQDIVIISEEFVWYGINEIASRQLNYVVINQGLFATFYSDYLSANQIKEFYKNSKLVIVNSDYTARGVRKLFDIDSKKIKKYIIGIDSKLFSSANKTKDVCYSAYKNSSIGVFVENYLNLKYPFCSVTKIEHTTRKQFADIVNTHKLFLSLGGPEGFGMPPLEAAIAGCRVIGFDAYAGSEYFLPPTFIKVNQNDHLDFIDKIDYAIDNIDDSSLYDTEYVDHLRHKYSLENSRKSIIDIFSSI